MDQSGQCRCLVEPFDTSNACVANATRSSLDARNGSHCSRRRDHGGPLGLAPVGGLASGDRLASGLDVFGRALGGQLLSGRQSDRVSQGCRRRPASLGQESGRGRSDSGDVWRCSGKAARLVPAQRSHRVQPISRRSLVGATVRRPGPAHPGVWRCAEILCGRQAPRFTRGKAIWVANADGGDAHEVPGVPKSPWNGERLPDLSPDGRTIAFFHPVTPHLG